MRDFFEFIAMLILLIKVIFHTIIFFIGLFFLPFVIWKQGGLVGFKEEIWKDALL